MNTLLKHQTQGVKWMLEREGTAEGEVKGGILADEAGLGKKIQIITTMMKNPQKRTLIITPYSSLNVWAESLNVIQLNTEKAWDSLKIESEETKYYLVNYQKINRRQRLLDLVWDRIVFDDARVLQNPANKIFAAASKLLGKIRWVLISEKPANLLPLFSLLKVDPREDRTRSRVRSTSELCSREDLILSRSLYRIQGGPPKPDIFKIQLEDSTPGSSTAMEALKNISLKVAKPTVIYCYNIYEVHNVHAYLLEQGFNDLFTCYKDHVDQLTNAINNPNPTLIFCTRAILQRLKLHMFKTIFFVNSKISDQTLERLIRRVICIGQKEIVKVFIM